MGKSYTMFNHTQDGGEISVLFKVSLIMKLECDALCEASCQFQGVSQFFIVGP